jgi:hypothetical protein
MTPEQHHRVAVFARYGPKCMGPGPHGGRRHADHVVPAQRILLARAHFRIRGINGMALSAGQLLLTQTPFDVLKADGRNGAVFCERCHGKKHRSEVPFASLPAIVKASVETFALQFGLEPALDREFPDRGVSYPVTRHEPRRGPDTARHG